MNNIVIIGKSGTGKSEVIKALDKVYEENHESLGHFMQYTTKPVDAVNRELFWYVSETDMDKLNEKFNVPYCRNFYGISQDEKVHEWRYALFKSSVYILSHPDCSPVDYVLDGDIDLAEMIAEKHKIIVIYLMASEAKRREKLKARGRDCDKEIEMRMKCDDTDYTKDRLIALSENPNVDFIAFASAALTPEVLAKLIYTYVKASDEEEESE